MKGIVLMTCCLWVLLPVQAAPAPPGPEPVGVDAETAVTGLIDSYIRSFPEREAFSGVILVADGDRILFHRGYGLANREFGIPNGVSTRFQIGSISKVFTAILALKQVEEGRLDLDKTISDYLLYYPPEGGRQITLRQLLSHTSGIPHHYQALPDYFATRDHYFHTPRDLVQLFQDVPLKHKPGERFIYSSPGYYILGAILQQVTGKSYAELLEEDICTPLGLADTFVDNNRTRGRNLATGYLRGLSGSITAYREDKSTALAAGDLISTAYDLYRWQKTLTLAGDRILTAASKLTLFQPIVPDRPMTMAQLFFRIPYADGSKTLAVNILSGSSSGYAAYLARQTEADRCVIVLSNVNGADVGRIGDDIGDMVNRRVLGIAIGEEAPLTRTPPPAAPLLVAERQKHCGFYRGEAGGCTGVVEDGGRLYYVEFSPRQGVQSVMELIPAPGGEWYLGHNPAFRCVFSPGPDGATEQLTAFRNGRAFNRADRLHPEPVEAADYAGGFTSVELQQTFRLTVRGGSLVAEHFLQPGDSPLVPLGQDLFGFRQGFIRYFRNGQGAINGFDVFTPATDGWFGSRFVKIAQ